MIKASKKQQQYAKLKEEQHEQADGKRRSASSKLTLDTKTAGNCETEGVPERRRWIKAAIAYQGHLAEEYGLGWVTVTRQ